MIKDSCYFYKKGRCSALKTLECNRKNKCSFYKTREEEINNLKKYPLYWVHEGKYERKVK